MMDGQSANGTPIKATASQTIGPFFLIASDWWNRSDLVSASDPRRLTIRGRVVDGADSPVSDALIEIWQADGDGRFPPESGPDWNGFGRCPTGADGEFAFTTLKPGAVMGQNGPEAPHIDVAVFARGLLQRLVTRIYFPDEAAANAADPALSAVEEGRRATLVATSDPSGGLRFDIHLQGPRETVFFTY